MPELKPGETEAEWMSRCVPDLEKNEGRPHDQAVAICLSKYETKEGDSVNEQELMHFAVSFAELDEIRKAEGIIHELHELKTDFADISQNIMNDPEIKDKAAALSVIVKELGERLVIAEEEKEIAEEEVAEEGKKDLLQVVKGWFDEIKALLIPKPEEPEEQKIGFKTHVVNGQDWIVVWTTNGFKDREKETFRTEAIEAYVDRHVDDDIKGEFWFWHLPGTKFADIKLQGVVGRFLVEAGPFDNSFVGQSFKDFFNEYANGHPVLAPEGWGASHGYRYDPEDRKDGIYDWFEKKESSVLPASMAANPYNPGFQLDVKEEDIIMDQKVREQWEGVFGKELVDAITQTGETKTVELEEAGVEFKGETVEPVEEITEEVKTESVVAETEDVATESAEELTEEVKEEAIEEAPVDVITRDEIKAVLQEIVETLRAEMREETQKQIGETVDGLNEILVPMAKKINDLIQTEETKIAAQVAEIPTASRQTFVESILGSKETVVDRRTSYGRDGPQEAEESDGGEFPSVKGVSLELWK